jgi:uncharacterized OB-fold protein
MTYGDAGENSRQATHCSNKDYNFFYEGLDQGKLLIQQCSACGAFRNPPGPMCPRCMSLEWKAVPSKGTGTIFSYTIHYHPPLLGFDVPHPAVLVELDEGIRMVGALAGVPIDQVRIGMPVEAEIVRRNGLSSFNFRPAPGAAQAA